MVRSQREIAGALAELCRSGAPVTAMLQSGEQLFLSRLLRVEREAGYFVLACSATAKRANTVLVAEEMLRFAANHAGVHYEFEAGHPAETEEGGEAAFRLDFPQGLALLQRRSRQRIVVPPGIELRCVANLGPLSFDARVVDISTQGLGSIVYDPGVHLEPGMRLPGATIVHPRRPPVIADLLVRHVRRQALPDGSYVLRAGCSFVGSPAEVEALIALFVTQVQA